MSIINKIFILITMLLFIGCKDAYIHQQDIFSNHLETKASSDVATMQRGQNPMKRPSYEEYQESIK